MIRVHVRHIKSGNLKYCHKGARFWFQFHNLDWIDFIKNGLPVETLEATGDAMALAAVEEARKEWAANQASKL